MVRLQKVRLTFQKFNAHLYAISVDPPKTQARLKRRLGLSFPLLSDPTLRAIDTYALRQKNSQIALPALFIVDHRGVVRWSYISKPPADRPKEDVLLKVVQRIEMLRKTSQKTPTSQQHRPLKGHLKKQQKKKAVKIAPTTRAKGK